MGVARQFKKCVDLFDFVMDVVRARGGEIKIYHFEGQGFRAIRFRLEIKDRYVSRDDDIVRDFKGVS